DPPSSATELISRSRERTTSKSFPPTFRREHSGHPPSEVTGRAFRDRQVIWRNGFLSRDKTQSRRHDEQWTIHKCGDPANTEEAFSSIEFPSGQPRLDRGFAEFSQPRSCETG